MALFKLHIRPAQKTELETLHAISVETFKETFEAENTKENMADYLNNQLGQEQIGNELSNSNTSFYFAYCNDVLVGYLKLNFEEAQKEVVLEGKAFEIERIYILKAYQGKGLGTQLFNNALKIGKEKGCQKMWLGVWEFNRKAITFYKKKGLKAFGSHVFQLGNDRQKDILMQLVF